VVERILEIEDGRRMAYTVVRGIPVRNYRAEVSLTPSGAGTHVRWSADWDRTLLGRIVRRRLSSAYAEVVSRLVAAADEAVGTGG
jgi:carbon monoxide dehydrogenase subunit G